MVSPKKRQVGEKEKIMRRGTDGTKILATPIEKHEAGLSGGRVIGVSFGADAASEHETGIGGIRELFGIPDAPRRDLLGADARTITKLPEELIYHESGEYVYLACSSRFTGQYCEAPSALLLDCMMEARLDEKLSAAWSSRDFGLRMKNEALDEGKVCLGQIYDAFTQLDIVMYIARGSGPFISGGLTFLIRSRMPEDLLSSMRSGDEDRLNLQDASDATGIIAKLRESDRKFFACSPRWAKDIKGCSSAHEVAYWLNPEDQRAFRSGWFTVEDLLEWIEGKGPVVQSQKVA